MYRRDRGSSAHCSHLIMLNLVISGRISNNITDLALGGEMML